jgi:uncharacterized membrane protein (DUF106 family)
MYLTSIIAHITLILCILSTIYQVILRYVITQSKQLHQLHHSNKAIPKLHKYLRKWTYHLARLNDKIDLYFKDNYKVVHYQVKKPNMRLRDLTRVPYGYHKWRRKQQARIRCKQHVQVVKTGQSRIMCIPKHNPD